jgi:hypothetical protein
MTTDELLEIYDSTLETWRFQVNSHWQRSSYFAAFETVAVAAAWTLLTNYSSQKLAGIVLPVLGIALTGVWFLNNSKTHFYARYWFQKVSDIERKLVERGDEQDIDFASRLLTRQRTDSIPHPRLVQSVPLFFLIAWIFLLGFGIRSLMINSGAMGRPVTYDVVYLGIAVASLVTSAAAALIAKSSLSQAKRVAERDRKEWKQRTWFDLYFKGCEFCDFWEHFQARYATGSADIWKTPGIEKDYTELMFLARKVLSMAVVLPVNKVIDELCASTAVFKNPNEALSEPRLKKAADAVEGLRQMALMDKSVLE